MQVVSCAATQPVASAHDTWPVWHLVWHVRFFISLLC